MSARAARSPSLPAAWPLAGSLLVTAAVVAFVCTPPAAHLHSWAAILSRATLYLLAAGAVHALAVWGICRVREETEDAGLPVIWALIWAAWIVVVWLPLVALLTAEHSPWVAGVLPLTAVFATLLLSWRRVHIEPEDDISIADYRATTPFQLLGSPLWRSLLPAVGTSVAAQVGVGLLAGRHPWGAGCLFGLATIYPLWRWMDRPGDSQRANGWSRTATGNSVIVWLLIVLALIPFMALYTSGAVSRLLGIRISAAQGASKPLHAAGRSSGYIGIVLTQPRKPHEIIAPAPMSTSGSLKPLRVIPFDGAYWYFKQPDARPAPDARLMQGDPVKKRIFSTDERPLVMEAHQPLGREIPMSCCRTLRLDVLNGDNAPGKIAVEVLLRDSGSAKKAAVVSLGTFVLASSTESPMPLKRPPVDDKVTFQLPRSAQGAKFNEITVRIKPDRSRAMAGAQVAIKDFVLQP